MTSTWKPQPSGRGSGAPPPAHSDDVAEILHRLQAGFFRARVRPVDFFADYDKHNSGMSSTLSSVCRYNVGRRCD